MPGDSFAGMSKQRVSTLLGKLRTPNFLANTELGTVLHLTADHVEQVGIKGMSFSPSNLCKDPGVAYLQQHNLSLRKFLHLDDSMLLALHPNPQQQGNFLQGKSFVVVNERKGYARLSPAEYMQFAQTSGADLAVMLADETPNEATAKKAMKTVYKSLDWTDRCLNEYTASKTEHGVLFGNIQGGLHTDAREFCATSMASKPQLGGFAIGGLFATNDVGKRYELLDAVIGVLPEDKPRWLVGPATPWDVLRAVSRGVDLFDGQYAYQQTQARVALTFNMQESKAPMRPYQKDVMQDPAWRTDMGRLVEDCECLACANYSRAYLVHCLNAGELLGDVLLYAHNLTHMQKLFANIRDAIEAKSFDAFAAQFCSTYHE